MNRPIELRAWNLVVGHMQYFTLPEIEQQKGKIQWHTIIIMQYIGIEDRNGKKIYDGDIVRKHLSPGVRYGDGKGNWVTYQDRGVVIEDDLTVSIYAPVTYDGALWMQQDASGEDALEIIGNIYENPELLNNLKP